MRRKLSLWCYLFEHNYVVYVLAKNHLKVHISFIFYLSFFIIIIIYIIYIIILSIFYLSFILEKLLKLE